MLLNIQYNNRYQVQIFIQINHLIFMDISVKILMVKLIFNHNIFL